MPKRTWRTNVRFVGPIASTPSPVQSCQQVTPFEKGKQREIAVRARGDGRRGERLLAERGGSVLEPP